MTFTNWSISEETLLDVAHIAVPIHGVFCVLSQILNGMLVLVTIKSPRLRSNCNILIGIQAASDMVFCWYFPFFAYNSYSNRFVTVSQCFFAQLIPAAGMNMSHIVMLFIGLDRYLCVVHALRYKSIRRHHYFGIYATMAAMYCGSIAILLYFTRSEDKVLCFIPEAAVESAKTVWIAAGCCLTAVIVVVYAKILLYIRKRPSEADQETKRIFKALFVIVTIYVLGYGATVYLLIVSRILFSDPKLGQVAEFSAGSFAGVNLDMAFIVYYTLSPVYKAEIRRFFGLSKIVESSTVFASAEDVRNRIRRESTI
ncbi:hypothetical protein QR680_014115 [Steinernema hermaphroditum]|uniref:G-protein coupled receptors family 1 profile domain-containing protein n=1 Tax=Steinernema hermaphroditum TaxID=289476 RepID=A0AA39IA15_9BILA|nr:hypothetical protein QR680_014115 [Steinernema hermaphroditum]